MKGRGGSCLNVIFLIGFIKFQSLVLPHGEFSWQLLHMAAMEFDYYYAVHDKNVTVLLGIRPAC